MRLVASLLAVALVVTLAPIARAQVNTETLRKRIHSVGYTGIIEGSVSGDTGNSTGITAGGGVGGGWAHEPHLLFGYGRFDYARYNGATSVNKAFAHARYNYEFVEWIWGELFTQLQSDEFQRLKLRTLFGIGPRLRLFHQLLPQDFDVYFGTGYMYERDVIRVEPDTPDENIEIWHRWSSYIAAQWEIDERAILATTMYVQPAFDDFSNVRLLDETLFTFKVTPVLSSSIAFTVHYDSAPPSGVLPTDTSLKNTIALTF